MIPRRHLFALTAAFVIPLAPPALAGPAPEKDRASILAMAGDYKVRFDMRETTAFAPGYKPLEPKLSGGYESVWVVEDQGDVIRLQHLLVVEDDGKPVVVKHWR